MNIEVKEIGGGWIEILGVKYVHVNEYNAQIEEHFNKGRKSALRDPVIHIAEIQECPNCKLK